MANDVIKLRAEAKVLGIDGYRKMSPAELADAIKRAKGTKGGKTAAKPAETSTNGASAKRKPAAKTARKTATKTADKPKASPRKSASKTMARKTSVKSAPATSAKKTGTAKRPASGAGKTKITARATTPKAKTNGAVGRMAIDNASIDWTVESSVGNDPKSNRGVIMKYLRQFKGNVEKVYGKLADKAQEMYPKTAEGRKRGKADAQALLRWHISRVKFDFVKDTNQHESVSRSNGSKATSASKSAGKSKAKPKATRKPAARQKPAQRATRGSTKKPATRKSTAKPKATAGKSAASRKRKR